MNNIDVLEINFDNINNDYKNHNVDLYIAKIELETIIKKLTQFCNKNNLKIQKLLFNAKKLLEEVEHEIYLQEKEENLRRNMQEEFGV